MPNRMIRDGFLDSPKVDSLSAAGERFFHRLLVASDDAGRMDGRPAMLRSRLFPLRRDIQTEQIDEWRAECASAGLIEVYQFRDQDYIQIAKAQKYGRKENSRYPWKDGTFRIEYRVVETRDGVCEYVSTSLPNADPISTPSAPHRAAKRRLPTGTDTSTDTDTRTKDLLLEYKKRLNALYGRRETTQWSDKEDKKLRLLVQSKDFLEELISIEQYFKAKRNSGEGKYLRHDLMTLMNNWSGELDRARKLVTTEPHPQGHAGIPPEAAEAML